MVYICVDTCVWLDLAKNTVQTTLDVVVDLVKGKKIGLVIPELIVDEFERNKDRVIKESAQSLSTTLKRVKDAVSKFYSLETRENALDLLNDVDYKIPTLGALANENIQKIEKLFKSATIIPASDNIKLRAANRAIERKAPFHLSKNSMNDAIIIETYIQIIGKSKPRDRFAFVTHNTTDFSVYKGNNKIPHPDIANAFSKIKSLYFINLAEAVYKFEPNAISEKQILEELFQSNPRNYTEIKDAENEFSRKVWYNRHQITKAKVDSGTIKIIKGKRHNLFSYNNEIDDIIWSAALMAAKAYEREYGVDNLGPWSDFEWGMLNGKLSAIRWVLGDEWDNLDT